MTAILARVPIARLLRTPRGWLPIACWVVIAIAVALVARASGGGTGADHTMRGAFAVLVLPLLSYGIVSAVFGGAGLRTGIRGVVALGAEPKQAALASILVALVACAAVTSVLGVLVCALAHGPHDPPVGRDLFASLWVSGLGGAAYGAYFSAGSALGKGFLRGAFLAFDWVVGSSVGLGATLTPRGHVMSLLGGHRVAELSQRTSSVMLLLLVLLYVAFALALSRKA